MVEPPKSLGEKGKNTSAPRKKGNTGVLSYGCKTSSDYLKIRVLNARRGVINLQCRGTNEE